MKLIEQSNSKMVFQSLVIYQYEVIIINLFFWHFGVYSVIWRYEWLLH